MTKKELCKEIGRTICLTAVLVFCFVLLSGALHAEGIGSIDQAPQQIEPATGHYLVSDMQGNGVTVIRQHNTLLVKIITYDDAGQPVWYQASGAYDWDTNTFVAPLYHYTDGSCALCAPARPQRTPPISDNLGTLSITWQSNTQAMMTLPNDNVLHLHLFNFGLPPIAIPKKEYFGDSASN